MSDRMVGVSSGHFFKQDAMKIDKLIPVFVEFIPDVMEDGKLYVSEVYNVAVHNCACGCGQKTVTPLEHGVDRTFAREWEYRREGDLITLNPSISNAAFCPVKAHYYVRANRVVWCQ